MKKVKKNTIKAIEYSIQNPTLSISEIGRRFNVDRHQIVKYKKNNEYLKYTIENKDNQQDDCYYYFTLEDLSFIDYYLSHPNLAYEKICNNFSNSPKRDTLYRWLKILGKEKTEGGLIKYHYNRNAFSEILTEEDAYWLGFITADGCIIENRWLQIQLAEKDRNHIKKFCYYLGFSEDEAEEAIKKSFGGAYTRDNPVSCLKVCSMEIISNLQDKGIDFRKSGKEHPYICPTLELQTAYVRGLIDGDGYIRSTQWGVGIVGSFEICSYVQNFINKNIIDISNNHIREHGIIYKLEISGHIQTQKILKFLYENASIYLDRKYLLYKERYV